MNLKDSLRTEKGVLLSALALTGLVLFESIVPPWAPYFIAYAVLAIYIPLYTGSFRFGGLAQVLKNHWKLTAVIAAVGLLWDQGISTFLVDRILAAAGLADNPFYSVTAALTVLAENAGIKFGISADTAILLYAVFIIFWAPIGEELFYRGYMQGLLKKRGTFVSAMLISAFFFSIRHMTHFFFLLPDVPWIASASWAVSTFVFGLLMSYLYEKTESLWPPILVHTLVNVVAVLIST